MEGSGSGSDKTLAGLALAAVVLVFAIGYLGNGEHRPASGTTAWTNAEKTTLEYISDWPRDSGAAARLMLGRYGPPDRYAEDAELDAAGKTSPCLKGLMVPDRADFMLPRGGPLVP